MKLNQVYKGYAQKLRCTVDRIENVSFTSADPNQKDQHKETFLWSHKSHSLDSNHFSFQSSSSIISTCIQPFKIHINVFHLQSPEFFEILLFSRTSCSSLDASERLRHQQRHKPRFPAERTAEAGRPSSQWGACFGNFLSDHQYCLFWGRRCEHDKWKIFLSANNMSVTTYQLLPFGDLRRLTLGSILVQSWVSSSGVCSTISWYIFIEMMSWLSAQSKRHQDHCGHLGEI